MFPASSAESSVVDVAPVIRRRPRDRKQQIISAARDLFVEHGYPNVTMAMIADHVGVTAGAVYRHVSNKAALLQEVFADNFGWVETVAPDAEFAAVVERMITTLGEHPFLANLWIHEARYLDDPVKRDLRQRITSWNSSLAPALRREQPELDDGHVELLGWAMQSLLTSVSRRAMPASIPDRVPEVRRALHSVLHARLAPTGPVRSAVPATRLPASTRERLLLAAVGQFRRRGYLETSMASIGAEADVTGPNLYVYFESKGDVLRAVLERGSHVLWNDLDEAVGSAVDPTDALRALIASYVTRSKSFAGTLEEPTGGDQEWARSIQREYVQEWSTLLRELTPKLGSRQAVVRVQLALHLITDLHHNRRVCEADSFEENLTALAAAILLPSAETAG